MGACESCVWRGGRCLLKRGQDVWMTGRWDCERGRLNLNIQEGSLPKGQRLWLKEAQHAAKTGFQLASRMANQGVVQKMPQQHKLKREAESDKDELLISDRRSFGVSGRDSELIYKWEDVFWLMGVYIRIRVLMQMCGVSHLACKHHMCSIEERLPGV